MEKHTMQDGPIPLFGSLPSAVSRQWGQTSMGSAEQSTTFTYPIAFPSSLLSVAASDTGSGAQGFGVTPIDNRQAKTFRSGVGYDGSGRLIIIGR